MSLIMSTIMALAFIHVNASATVIRGAEAEASYQELRAEYDRDPSRVYLNTNSYFGDIERPHLGRLWLTMLFRRDHRDRDCYQYDFREQGVIEYLCAIKEPAL